jgi:hypothetical protein
MQRQNKKRPLEAPGAFQFQVDINRRLAAAADETEPTDHGQAKESQSCWFRNDGAFRQRLNAG